LNACESRRITVRYMYVSSSAPPVRLATFAFALPNLVDPRPWVTSMAVCVHSILLRWLQELPKLADRDTLDGQHAVLQAVQVLSVDRRHELA